MFKRSGTVWKFDTAHFTVCLKIERLHDYVYDGDDEDGEYQRRINNGELIAFDSIVTIEYDNHEISSDSLGGSVYERNNVSDFWSAHRDSDPMNRNCTIYRATHGENCCVCHYFPNMVREAIRAARQHFANMPKLRAA